MGGDIARFLPDIGLKGFDSPAPPAPLPGGCEA